MTKYQAIERTLTKANIDEFAARYTALIASLGPSLVGKPGVPLLLALKRQIVGTGPYPNVTMFEAANRIMSDLVILNGVRWLLNTHALPFASYQVELGNEDHNGFDIRASDATASLVGEAFNVAPTYFPTKKWGALRKLRMNGASSTLRMLMFNSDAVGPTYRPAAEPGLCVVVVDVATGNARLVSSDPLVIALARA